MRDEHLQAFLSAARARTAVDARRRRRWLTQQLHEDQTFVALCRAMVEARARVEVSVASGRSYRGAMVVACADHVAVAGDDRTVYVAMPALVALRPLTGPAGAAAAPPVRAATFDDAVVALGACGRAIDVCTIDGRAHRGRVAGVGRDLLRFDDGRHLRLDMVTAVATSP